jgi:ketosteroid isomerase-like protein
VASAFTRKSILALLGISVLVLSSFTLGFYTCLHLKSGVSSQVSHLYLTYSGDAPAPVRLGVLASLRDFQKGYVRRDIRELDEFMNRLFPNSDDILLLGTNSGEWVQGRSAVSKFIGDDWQKWGDFRFSVENSVVSSAGDVAWVASTGVVHDQMADRPVRFSAMLTRNGNTWVFRQLQFQWDDRDPRLADFLRASLYRKVGKLCIQKVDLMIQNPTGVQTP